MFRRLVVLAGGVLLLSSSLATAQDAILGQMYGAGVHAYYSNDYYQAYEQFSSAIKAGSQDPRCYYYRGLSLIRLGRGEEAQTDFQAGAKLETADVNRFFNVPAALQRIQGGDRLIVEQYRTQARMVALQRDHQRRAARYGELRQEEQRVLQKQAEAAPATPPAMTAQPTAQVGAFQSGPIDEPKPETPTAPMPKADEPAATATAEPAAPAADDPFAAKPKASKAADKPAADDPFGDKPAAKADEKKEEPKNDDPFGAAEKPAAEKKDKPVADDPFGGMPAEKPAAEEKKAEPKNDNPFGNMPEEKPAADEKKAESKSDAPAAKKDEKKDGAVPDDPFK